jgi:hypothetical protein
MDTSNTLAAWLKSLRLGEMQTLGDLTIVAVHSAEMSSVLEYRTLSQALEDGLALVTEKPQASVPTLQVINSGDLPLLLIDGEEIVGGRQNRVVNTTVLVPAHSAFELDVTCVEHGRWFESAAAFAPGEAVYPTLRGQKAQQVSAALAATASAQANQTLVWGEIANRQHRAGTVAPTDALHDMYAQRNEALSEAEARLEVPQEAVGLIVVIRGRARCADVFDKPATLRAYWSRLVRSYALEAENTGVASATDLGSAKRLLSRASRATRREFASRGLGIDVRLSGSGITGAALVHQDVVAHTAIFRQAGQVTASTIRRPGERARRLGL